MIVSCSVPRRGHERGVRPSPHPNLKPDACSLKPTNETYKTGKNFSSSYGVTCTL